MSHKAKRTLLNFCISLAVIAICVVALKMSYGSRVFRRYVCKPIPKSVKGIKVDHPWELSGHRYVMHFKISKDDVMLILNARRFREVTNVEYETGTLCWDVDPSHGHALPLYYAHKGQLGPDWFRPEEWVDPKCCEFKERNIRYRQQIQILIYNDDLGEAYFVEYQEGY